MSDHGVSHDCGQLDETIGDWQISRGFTHAIPANDCMMVRPPPLICPEDDAYPSCGRGCAGVLYTAACYRSVGAVS